MHAFGSFSLEPRLFAGNLPSREAWSADKIAPSSRAVVALITCLALQHVIKGSR